MRYALSPAPLLGPCRCMGCGEPLFWARRQSRHEGVVFGLMGWREYTGHLHACHGPSVRSRATARSNRRRSQLRHEAMHHAGVA